MNLILLESANQVERLRSEQDDIDGISSARFLYSQTIAAMEAALSPAIAGVVDINQYTQRKQTLKHIR